MSFISHAIQDVGHVLGGVAKGLGPLGTAAALGAGLYFGMPYLSALAAPEAGAGGVMATGAAAGAGAGAGIWGGTLSAAGMGASGTLASDAILPTTADVSSLGLGAAGTLGSDAILPSTSGLTAADLSGAATAGAGAGTASLGGQTINPITGALTTAAPASPISQGLSLNPSTWSLSNAAKSLGSLPLTSDLSIASGIYGMTQAQQLQQLAQMQAAQQQTLFNQQQGYAGQLSQLSQNPGMVTSLPGYQAGLQAVERSQAANGYLGSGNMMAALQQYGGQAYQQQFNNLSALSGLTNPPNNYATQTAAAGAQLSSASQGSIGYGVALPQLTAMMAKYSSPTG